jgi:tetratricopeptide (TPR) repeat protein
MILAISSCGYFNSLYNANRQFADAERARQRGDIAAARTAYTSSIEKAAKSYRKYPNGRWADDALYVIGRARFELGEYPAARAAFQELLSKTEDGAVRAGAQAYHGASELGFANAQAAVAQLDSAIVQLPNNDPLASFAHLWRARAYAAVGDMAAAWSDLDAVSAADAPNFEAVQIERISLAVDAGDSAHVRAGFEALLRSENLRRHLDTLSVLATRAAVRFGPEYARAIIASQSGAMAAPARDTLALIRAQIASAAGDTTVAHREFTALADRAASAIASAARVDLARSRLRAVSKLEQLQDLRSLLLPAINSIDAVNIIRAMRMVEVLAQRSAETGQPLAIFAAAEIARDELHAPTLARQLFVTFVDIAPNTPWAGKALLAAIAVDPAAPEANALRTRITTLPANPYTAIVNGEGAVDAFELAEDRLSRSMVAVLAEAANLAQQREGAVTRAVFVLDSIKVAARADTVRAKCGLMIDTLAIAGVRADSVRASCLRGDDENMTAYLSIDTLLWNPVARDSILKRNTRRTRTLKTETIK